MGEDTHMWGQGIYGKSLYLPLNFSLTLKIKFILKKNESLTIHDTIVKYFEYTTKWGKKQYTKQYCCCCCSVAKSCLTVWDPMDCNMLGFPVFTISWSLLKFLSIELVMPSNHLILCHPLLLLPSIFPSIKVFSNESALRIKWSKYWSFSFTISPSDEYSGLISFRIDWFVLFAAQGTFRSLLQHHSSKLSVLWGSIFSMVNSRVCT